MRVAQQTAPIRLDMPSGNCCYAAAEKQKTQRFVTTCYEGGAFSRRVLQSQVSKP